MSDEPLNCALVASPFDSKAIGKPGTFFRVLYSEKHLPIWEMEPVGKSSHHRPPVCWTSRWDKTHEKDNAEENYPLRSLDFGKWVRFTARAREVFLADPDKFTYQFNTLHPFSQEVYEVGQLDGICAFQSAQGCLDWVANDPMRKLRANTFTYVVFEGTYVSEAPESEGVVAALRKRLGAPMSLTDFKARFLPAVKN